MNKKYVWGFVILSALAIAVLNIMQLFNRKSEPIEIKTNEPLVIKTSTTTTSTTTTTTTTTKKTTKKVTSSINYKNGFKAFITHYGPDCRGCSGTTASGYNVRNTIYYNDWQYGEVRIVATSRNIPMYTVIRINDYKKGSFIAIVLDRGVSGNKVDVLVSSEKEASILGIQKNADVEVLRWGK